MKHKALIVDDEPLARQLLRQYLQGYDTLEIVGEAGDGFEAYKLIQQWQPELIFLDAQMPRLTGFEMLELIEAPPAIIFTTAFDQYALKAFEAQALDYLLKPINPERLDAAVKKFLTRTAPVVHTQEAAWPLPEAYLQRLAVKDRDTIRIIPVSEILYVEASDDYIRIHTPGGHYLKKGTLSRLAEALDPNQFVRVHRSFLIPVTQLRQIEPYEKESHLALLHCGARVSVSKSGLSKLKEVLGW